MTDPCLSMGITSSGPGGSTGQPASKYSRSCFVLQEVFCWFIHTGVSFDG